MVVPPEATVCAGIDPTRLGRRFGSDTVTRTCWVALRPPGSRAVTVIVALPARAPVIVTVEPDTDARATLELEEVAEYVSASPSGSLKYCDTLTLVLLPTWTVCAGTDPTERGARFDRGTVTAIRCVAVSPPGSRAVTVIVALPAASPVIVTVEPDADARATPEPEAVAE